MPQTAICSVLSSTRAVLIPNNLIILWLFAWHARVFDLDGGVLGADSWSLSPKRPAGSLARDSDAYQSFSHDLHILQQHPRHARPPACKRNGPVQFCEVAWLLLRSFQSLHGGCLGLLPLGRFNKTHPSVCRNRKQS